MNRRPFAPLIAAGAIALTGALVAAGWLGASSRGATHVTASVQWVEPAFVPAAQGWLPMSQEDARPAFDVRNCPWLAEIYDLGPAKDAIPAITEPAFTSAAEALWLDEREPVLGLKIGADTRCYPVRLMNWHSLVHDRLNGQTVYVFWDPPSGLGLARRVWARARPLGVAGLGFRGTGLAFDRSTGALWDLFGGGPISAPHTSVTPQLPDDYQWLPLERMTWRAWRRLHGRTLVLSQETGYPFNYALDPYAAAVSPTGEAENYWSSSTILAPAALRVGNELVPDKAMVLGFLTGSEQWAAPIDELNTQQGTVQIETAAGKVTVHIEPQDDSYVARDEQGKWLPQVRMFWFAWKARFPETKLWHPEPEED